MKFTILSLMVFIASSAFAQEAVSIDPAAGLLGYSHCKSVGGDDAYVAKIYIHEDFLQDSSYGIMTAELVGVPAFNLYANFITTSPGMSDSNFTLDISWNGHKLGTLNVEGQGLSGTLILEDVTLKCQPLNVTFE